MTDITAARSYRQRYLFNICLAIAAKTDGSLKEACDLAEEAFAAALAESRENGAREQREKDVKIADGFRCSMCGAGPQIAAAIGALEE